MTGVDKGYISKLGTKIRNAPSYPIMRNLASTLEVSVEDLINIDVLNCETHKLKVYENLSMLNVIINPIEILKDISIINPIKGDKVLKGK